MTVYEMLSLYIWGFGIGFVTGHFVIPWLSSLDYKTLLKRWTRSAGGVAKK